MTIPTGDQKDRREILRTLEGDGPFFITSHRNPDGDAVGSLLALSMWLTGRGKDARAACADPVPSQYQFLPGIDRVGLGLPDTLRGAVGIVVDSPDAARVAEDPSVLSSADVLVNVDHHVGNSRYGDLNLVDPTASSTALILHEMLSDLGGPPSREVASALYVGVLTDTGAFRFSNTDARTFAAAAELTRLGADAAGVA
jgi:phosphoesterase RecJ-like protein